MAAKRSAALGQRLLSHRRQSLRPGMGGCDGTQWLRHEERLL